MHWEVLWGEGGSRRFWKVPEVLPCPTRVEEYGLREFGRTKGGKPHEAVSPEERKRRREADSGGRYFNFPSHHPNLLKMARNNFPLSWENALPVRALSSDLPADWSCEEHRVGGEPAAMLQCPPSGKAGSKAECVLPHHLHVCIHTAIIRGSHRHKGMPRGCSCCLVVGLGCGGGCRPLVQHAPVSWGKAMLDVAPWFCSSACRQQADSERCVETAGGSRD